MLLKDLKKIMFDSMKAKDKEKQTLLSVIIGNIENSGELKNDNVVESDVVLNSLFSMHKNILKAKNDLISKGYSCNHDFIVKADKELSILDNILPKRLSDKDLNDFVVNYIKDNNIDLSNKSSFGILMKDLKQALGVSFDGQKISGIIKGL